MAGTKVLKDTSAAKVVASSIGVVAGFAGMEHGFFEVLQGNVPPGGILIDAIGPAQRFWEHGSEPALTFVPNFSVTGILAMIIGLLVMIWSVAYIDKKYGTWVLMLLSIVMFLVGGGFSPPVYALLAIVAAARIDRPLTWWRKHLPLGVRGFLARYWLLFLIACVSLSLFLVELAIFGYPLLWFLNADDSLGLISAVGYITFFGLGPVVILSAFAHGIQRQIDSTPPPFPPPPAP